jgi:hypothetical protein
VGFRSVPVGGSGGGVFPRAGAGWRSDEESGAGAGCELPITLAVSSSAVAYAEEARG